MCRGFFLKKRFHSIQIRIFVIFMAASMAFCLFSYSAFYTTYINVTSHQLEQTCQNYFSATKVSLISFINETFAFSKQINNNTHLIELIKECYKNNGKISQQTADSIDYLLRRQIQENPRINSLRLYIDNSEPAYQTTNFYATNGIKTISKDYMSRSQWFNMAYEYAGKLIFRPTYQKIYNIPKTNYSKSYKYTENIFSFFKVLKDINNRNLAVICIDINESDLYAITQNLSLPSNTESYITDQDGNIITSSERGIVGLNIYEEKPFLPRTNQDIEQKIQDDTTEYLFNQHIFYFEDWHLITLTNTSKFFVDLISFNKVLTFFLLFFLLIAVLLGVIITKLYITPIHNLINNINTVKTGDLSVRIDTSDSYSEISDVQTSFNEMLDSIQKLVEENYEITIREKEAQIKSLEAQINPHFLYNTLDTINWKVYLLGGEDVSKLIQCLSQILRYSISSKLSVVTLQQDIEQVQNYLYIQKVRYEGRFIVKFDLHPDTMGLKIHKFLIQPIVENSIVHGLEEKESGGIIKISSQKTEDELIIEIFDNGIGMSAKQISTIFDNNTLFASGQHGEMRTHIGLNNVHNRLKFYYGEKYGLEIQSKEGEFTNVILHFPIVKSSESTI